MNTVRLSNYNYNDLLKDFNKDAIPFQNTIIKINHNDFNNADSIELIKVNRSIENVWEYCYMGDISFRYGGMFFEVEFDNENKLADWQYGYNNVLRLTEFYIDSVNTDALLVELGSVYIGKDIKDIKSAIESSGGIYGYDTLSKQISIVQALSFYWGIEADLTYTLVSIEDLNVKAINRLIKRVPFGTLVILPDWSNEAILSFLQAEGLLNQF